MKIMTVLMEPFLQQLKWELSSLEKNVGRHPSQEAAELCKVIEAKKEAADRLQALCSGLDCGQEAVVPAELYEAFRRLKLDLRFVRRNWLKILSNAERLQKMYARRTHVSTFAA